MNKLAAILVALLAGCDPSVTVHDVPLGSSVRVFYNLTGAVDVPANQVRDVAGGGRVATTSLPPEAYRWAPPLLSVEARRADGCLLANGTAHGWQVWLKPVEGCGTAWSMPPADLGHP